MKSPNFALLDVSRSDVRDAWPPWCRHVMPSIADHGRIRAIRPARHGGLTCLPIRVRADASGAPE